MASQQSAQSGVAGRYATALFDLATEAKATEEVGESLAKLKAMLGESTDFRRLVSSPVIQATDQEGAIAALAKKAGVSGLTLNFLTLLAHNRRLGLLEAIISAFDALVADERGETSAEVISAEKLTAPQLKDLKAALKAAIGRDVLLSTRVDKSILGGLIVKSGSKMMDNSLKTKLQNLKIAMKGTG